MPMRAEPIEVAQGRSGKFKDVTLVGFDSAWADNPRRPGAICALSFDGSGISRFMTPTLVGFDEAAALIATLRVSATKLLVAIDQPTIVRNQTGMRPCERAVASVMSWSGGGIQPAYRGKTALFGDGAPIWRFLHRLSLADDPERACHADMGAFVMEVFPALAVLAFDDAFAASKRGPRYNPARRRTFREQAWRAVLAATTRQAELLELGATATWCAELDNAGQSTKAEQDQLDAVICLIVAATWLQHRERCVMIGDLEQGYIVAPATDGVRARLAQAALRLGTRIS